MAHMNLLLSLSCALLFHLANGQLKSRARSIKGRCRFYNRSESHWPRVLPLLRLLP
jgi:hypothetical protein